MQKVLLMSLALGASALAAPFRINTATVFATEVREYNSQDHAKSFNVEAIEAAYPYISIKGVTTLPGNALLTSACKEAVLGVLKAPATAKFPTVTKPVYNPKGFVYVISGKVDSQNSYGALVRGTFYCMTAFQGTVKGGTLYTYADVITPR